MTAKLNPQKMIDAYKKASPKYRKARAAACRIQERDARMTPEQRAYWKAIADALEA